MATVGFSGRGITVSWAGTVIKGSKTKSATISREAVDITSDDDAGWAAYLAEPGKKSIEMSVEGITGDETLVAAAMTSGTYTLPEAVLTLPTGGTLTGNYFLSEIELNGETEGAYEFSATFMSSGPVVYAPDV